MTLCQFEVSHLGNEGNSDIKIFTNTKNEKHRFFAQVTFLI